MLRLSIATLVLAFVAATAARAQDYSDAEHNFRLSIPTGWEAQKDADKDLSLFVTSPRWQETRGACGVIGESDSETKDLAQADIDAMLDGQFGDAFWADVFKDDTDDKDRPSGFAVDASGSETVNGLKRYYAQIQYSGTGEGGETVKTKGRETIAFVPGWHYVIFCSARAEGYERESADFKTFFASFAPLSSAPVASNTPPRLPSLTLYSRSQFAGVSHIVTRDTPDLALYGWQGNAASLSVAGGVWEVCEAQDYRGRCRMVRSALPDGLGAHAAILSVRHAAFGVPAASLAARHAAQTMRRAHHR